jgi:simple sugar transport system permease protein
LKGLQLRHVVLVLAAFLLVVGLLRAVGVSAVPTFRFLFESSMGSAAAWSDTLKVMTPLLIAGLGVFVAFRAGLFNIGAEGQITVGALAAVWIGLQITGWLGIVAALVVGALAGALWALPAGLIKAYRGGHEVITTIMLNSIAGFLASYMVNGPLQLATGERPATDELSESTRLPFLADIGRFELSLGLILGLLLVPCFAHWLSRTVGGFEFRLTGENPTAARAAGVKVKRALTRAMAYSGGIAGFAGAVQLLAYDGYFFEGFSAGNGFDAIGVALLAGTSAWGVIPAAFLFGVLENGSQSLTIGDPIAGIPGVPNGLNGVLLGLVILVFAAVRFRRKGDKP